MNLQHERIAQQGQALQLDTLVAEWPNVAAQAASQEASFADFLERLLAVELNARRERSRSVMLKMATLPSVKTLEQYDFKFASGAPRSQLQELAGLAFIERAENILAASVKPIWQRPWPTAPLWRASRPALSRRLI